MFGIRPFFTVTETSVGLERSVGCCTDFLGDLVRGGSGGAGGGGGCTCGGRGDFIRKGVDGPFRRRSGDSGRGGGGGGDVGGGGELGGRGLLLVALVSWTFAGVRRRSIGAASVVSARACASLSLSAAMASSLDIPECGVFMPRVLARPRIPRRSLPRSTAGLSRDFGMPGRGSGGCTSIATYVVFATGAFFFFGLLNGFFLPFFTNFLAFPLPVPLAKPSPADSDSSSADSGLLTVSVVPTGLVGDAGNGFMDPALSLSKPVRGRGPEANEMT